GIDAAATPDKESAATGGPFTGGVARTSDGAVCSLPGNVGATRPSAGGALRADRGTGGPARLSGTRGRPCARDGAHCLRRRVASFRNHLPRRGPRLSAGFRRPRGGSAGEVEHSPLGLAPGGRGRGRAALDARTRPPLGFVRDLRPVEQTPELSF